jgi:two-component system alkaline phosphatase synthesis response regulator PhoP
MPGELVLVVDDELNIQELCRLYLAREGYRVEVAADGRAGYQAALNSQPDLLILDVMLPGLDGFEICRRLRAEGITLPIVMLTARDEDIDQILGLELGADVYLTKPFNPRELVAWVKATLRRTDWKVNDHQAIHLGNLRIDPAAREVWVGQQALGLRTQEFDVLWVLAENSGRVLTREKLLELAWGYDYYGQTRTVDVHISHLRRKLAGSQVKIETVSGVGYKLVY